MSRHEFLGVAFTFVTVGLFLLGLVMRCDQLERRIEKLEIKGK